MDEDEVNALYADLGAVPEIAAELGVNRKRVNRWIERREMVNCPFPVRQLVGIRLYSLSEWRTWFEVWRRTRGAETWWPYQDTLTPPEPAAPASVVDDVDTAREVMKVMSAVLATLPDEPDEEIEDDIDSDETDDSDE